MSGLSSILWTTANAIRVYRLDLSSRVGDSGCILLAACRRKVEDMNQGMAELMVEEESLNVTARVGALGEDRPAAIQQLHFLPGGVRCLPKYFSLR